MANFLGQLGQLGQGVMQADARFKQAQDRDLLSQMLGHNPEFAAQYTNSMGALQNQQALADNQQRETQRKSALKNLFTGGGATPMELQARAAQISPDEFGGGYLKALSAKPDIPSKIKEFQQFMQMDPQQQQLYSGLFGPSKTNVNVNNGGESPFNEKFLENLGKGRGDAVLTLEKESEDLMAQATGSEQALALLNNNPDIDINPLAPLTTQAKSLFAPFLSEDQLKNVADYQTLDSQLIRNRFDVTKVLKGAITEQEQAAAQRVAGKADGTREGLVRTLKNNIAFATLQADEKEKRSSYIRAMGESYSPKGFSEYYKKLGEEGGRPTLDGLLKDVQSQFPVQPEAPIRGPGLDGWSARVIGGG